MYFLHGRRELTLRLNAAMFFQVAVICWTMEEEEEEDEEKEEEEETRERGGGDTEHLASSAEGPSHV